MTKPPKDEAGSIMKHSSKCILLIIFGCTIQVSVFIGFRYSLNIFTSKPSPEMHIFVMTLKTSSAIH